MFNIWHVADKIAAIARKEIFYVWPFGLAAYLAGVVFIDRNNSKDAYRQLKVTSEVMIKNKVTFLNIGFEHNKIKDLYIESLKDDSQMNNNTFYKL